MNQSITLTIFQWIGTVVVAGIIVNLISAYLKPYTDRLLSRVSNRTAAIVARRQAIATRLLENPRAAVEYRTATALGVIMASVIYVMLMQLATLLILSPLVLPFTDNEFVTFRRVATGVFVVVAIGVLLTSLTVVSGAMERTLVLRMVRRMKRARAKSTAA